MEGNPQIILNNIKPFACNRFDTKKEKAKKIHLSRPAGLSNIRAITQNPLHTEKEGSGKIYREYISGQEAIILFWKILQNQIQPEQIEFVARVILEKIFSSILENTDKVFTFNTVNTQLHSDQIPVAVWPHTLYYFALLHLNDVNEQNSFIRNFQLLMPDYNYKDVYGLRSQIMYCETVEPMTPEIALVLLISLSPALSPSQKHNIIEKLLSYRPEIRCNPHIVSIGHSIRFNTYLQDCEYSNEALSVLPEGFAQCREEIRQMLLGYNDPKMIGENNQIELMLTANIDLIKTYIGCIYNIKRKIDKDNLAFNVMEPVDEVYQFICELLYHLSEESHRHYLQHQYGSKYFPCDGEPPETKFLSQAEIKLIHESDYIFEPTTKTSHRPIYPTFELILMNLKTQIEKYFYGDNPDSGGNGDIPVNPQPSPNLVGAS